MFDGQTLGVVIGLPSAIGTRQNASCSSGSFWLGGQCIGAAWSEAIRAHIFGSDADLSLQGLTASRVAFYFVSEVKSDFMIAIKVRLLESFNVWVNILVRGWAHHRRSVLYLHESLGSPMTALDHSTNLSRLDHVPIGESNIMLVAGAGCTQIYADPPAAAQLGRQPLGHREEDLFSKLNDLL